MSNLSVYVGRKIRNYRKQRGLTIREVSNLINKSKATISKYENGTIIIDIETLHDIARGLNIDMRYLLDYPSLQIQETPMPENIYFDTPEIFMYYYDGRSKSVIHSLIKLSPNPQSSSTETKTTLYVGFEDYQDFENCHHIFEGCMNSYDTITHFTLKNQINEIERIYLCVLNPLQTHTSAVGMLSGMGMDPFFAPIAIKCLLSKKKLQSTKNFMMHFFWTEMISAISRTIT